MGLALKAQHYVTTYAIVVGTVCLAVCVILVISLFRRNESGSAAPAPHQLDSQDDWLEYQANNK